MQAPVPCDSTASRLAKRCSSVSRMVKIIIGGVAYEGHNDKTDERLAHPECLRRLLHRLDENHAHQRDEHRDYGQHDQDQPYRLRGFACLGVLRAGKNFAVRLKREQQAQSVSDQSYG